VTLCLHPRLTLDFSARDLAYAVSACARQPDAEREAQALEVEWAPAGDGLAALSVRSAFDLYLTALDLPSGSEVLLSGVTIPDMVRVVREHGLVPVPVDLELGTLFPTPADCERAWSANARLLVVAHLFGGRNDLTPIAEWAHARGLLVVEDCAQGFIAPEERGSPFADATFYSFGSIKTMTALGGALVRVADARVLARMRATQDRWPEQSTRRFATKVVRSALLLLVQRPRVYATIAMLCDLTARDFDRLIQDSVKGFPVPPGGSLLPLLRHRPCGALLALLRYRLRTFDGRRLTARARQGEHAREVLVAHAPVFGAGQPLRTHWLFAIASTDRAAAMHMGRMMGLDVAPGASSIAAVPRPAERPDLPPLEAERFMERILFIPAHPGVPDASVERLAQLARCGARAGERADADQGPRGTTRIDCTANGGSAGFAGRARSRYTPGSAAVNRMS
jgi:perosamine synthetase